MLIIYTTIKNIEEAELIAQTLIAERLVACANLWPITSMYIWNERVEKTTEVGMFLKTCEAGQEPLYQRLLELHPYGCPAIITLAIQQTHSAFAQWVQTQVGA